MPICAVTELKKLDLSETDDYFLIAHESCVYLEAASRLKLKKLRSFQLPPQNLIYFGAIKTP